MTEQDEPTPQPVTIDANLTPGQPLPPELTQADPGLLVDSIRESQKPQIYPAPIPSHESRRYS